MRARRLIYALILLLFGGLWLESRPPRRSGRHSIRRQRRYRVYHRRYRYRNGRYYRGGRAYYYRGGRYYPDRRVYRNGRYRYKGRWYRVRRGRYWRNGRYYYYWNGRYYRDTRRWRWYNGYYWVRYDGHWYRYYGGRYYYNGIYFYYHDGRYYRDDRIRYNFAEALEDWDEDTGTDLTSRKNPSMPGAIHYVCKRWDRNIDNWFYFRNAYRPTKYKVSGPHTLRVAQKRVRRLNRATRERW